MTPKELLHSGERGEDGLAAFADRRDSRLRLFVANQYHRFGRDD
ncbi:MAG: hypothetical protein R6V05_08345 [Candidatus Brocadiia bacterium]